MLHSLVPMVFYDWLQRPNSIPSDISSHDGNNKSIVSRKKSTASADKEQNQIDIKEEAALKQLDEHVDKHIHVVVDAFPSLHSNVTDNSNDDTATLTAEEEEENDRDRSNQFLRAWEEHEKTMAQHHKQEKFLQGCCQDNDKLDDGGDNNDNDDDDDVEPLRKIPFLSIDLKLDETEHSDDDEEEYVTESSSLLLQQQQQQEVECFVLHTGATVTSCYYFEPDCTVKQQKQQQQAELSSLPTPPPEEDEEDARVPFLSLDLRLGLDETERSEEDDNYTGSNDNFVLHTGAPILEPLWNNDNNALTDNDDEDDDDDENDDEESSVDLEDILDRGGGGVSAGHHHLLFPGLLLSSSSSPILDVLSSSTKTRISACTSSPAVQELIARVSSSSSSSPPSPLSPSSFSLPPLIISHGDDTEHVTTTRNEDYQQEQQQQHYKSALLLPPSAPLSPVSRKSSSHGPELSGPAPPITHRTPIPTWISFSLCANNNNNNTGSSDSSFCLSSNQDGKEEDETLDMEDDKEEDMEELQQQQQQQQATYSPPLNEILDPTDPLICGKITSSDYLQAVSNQMEQFLLASSDDDIDTLCQVTISWMKQHPMVCQVKYRPPEFHGHCYPLSYFSAAGWLEGCQAAYNAFPEAIGQDDNSTGLPLHYACLHQAGYNVISFLVEKHPEATRITNNHQHETPLHLYCRSIFGGGDDDAKRNHDNYRSSADESGQLQVIELLLRHYPTAAQLADLDGFTPLHLACQRRNVRLPVLKALQASSPTVIRAATRSWHKPAHIAALHGASYPVMEWLLQTDPTVSRTTVEDFSTVLHCAVQGQCSPSVIRMIRDAHPKALTWTNSCDETPYHVGEKIGASPEILQLLTEPDNINNTTAVAITDY